MSLVVHHNFAADKTLSGRVGPALAITRASEGRYFDASGLLQVAASGEARYDHDPATGRSLGLLFERASENICLQSENMNATWLTAAGCLESFNAAVAPDGTMTVDFLSDNSGIFTGTQTQTVAIPADGSSYFFTFFSPKGAGGAPYPEVDLVLTGGTARQMTLQWDRATGAKGIRTSTGVVASFVENAGDFWRIGVKATNGTGNTSAVITFRPAASATLGGSLDATQTNGDTGFWGMQLESGLTPTSYIPTTTTSVSRAADQVSAAFAMDRSSGYSVYADVTTPSVVTTTIGLFGLLDSGAGFQNATYAVVETGTQLRFRHYDGTSGNLFLQYPGSMFPHTRYRLAAGVAVNDAAAYSAGVQTDTDISVTLPSVAVATLHMGNAAWVDSPWGGHIAEFRLYDDRASNDVLNNWSQGNLGDLEHNDPLLGHKSTGLQHNDLSLSHNEVSYRHNR
jgi:hypothetical protein